MCQGLLNCPRGLKNIICFFLACLLVFCFIAPPYLQAYAIVDIVLSGAISSTMSALFSLAGIKFASGSDLISGIELAWHNFDTTLRQSVSDLVGVGNPVEGVFEQATTLPLPAFLLSAVTARIHQVFSPTQTSVPSLPSTAVVKFPADTMYYNSSNFYTQFWFEGRLQHASDSSFISVSTMYNASPYYPGNIPIPFGDYRNNFKFWGEFLPYSDGLSTFYFSYSYTNISGNYVEGSRVLNIGSKRTWPSDIKFTTDDYSNVINPDVINPADLTYTSDKSICVDGILTKAMDDVLAKNPTKDTVSIVVPANAADFVDAGLKDVVTDKELSAAIDKAIADAGAGTVTGDITLPNVGELSLPDKIITVFPFSIPWDISRGLSVFKADPVAPRFEIPFFVAGVIDTKLVLDFTKFDFIIRFLNWGELTLFIVGLALLTRKVIRW